MPSKNINTSPKDLASWIDDRQAEGLYFFTREEAIKSLKMTEEAFRKAASRLAKKTRIVRIRSGFFVVVPLEYRAAGVLPAEWFIADLMAYLEQPYYVGVLTAAALYGAAHQQPQQFQVVTTAPQRGIQKKNLALRFFFKTNFDATPVTQMKVQTGYIAVSTPEATALDLIRYSRSIGGLDRVITVLQELGETIDAKKIQDAARKDGNLAYAQRLGWLMEKAGHTNVEALSRWVADQKPLPARLDPSQPIKGARKDNRWQLLINSDVESD
ncbi:MAG TPA: type IV toxin-antitoxin system AbiEi family antitoxin [Smithellaceae bacterium]|nr:type IV toxin-antitoxin system AbiEi family antitoxin [Smithellaceae bacterium]